MKHAHKHGRLITRPEEPKEALPEIAPGVYVRIGIRGDEEISAEWSWAIVRRVLDGRIWVAVNHTACADIHGIESGDELEVRREEIQEAHTPDDLQRKVARDVDAMRRLLLSAGELARDVDRHLKFDTAPTSREMARWVRMLEAIADYHEHIASHIGRLDGPEDPTPSAPGTAA
jgi:hypothetical protein